MNILNDELKRRDEDCIDFVHSERGVIGAFENRVRQCPDSIALVWVSENSDNGDIQVSYRALNSMATALSVRLTKEGIAEDCLVGISTTRSVSTIVCLLAILKAGACYIPLDSELPTNRLSLILDEAEVSKILIPGLEAFAFSQFSERLIIVDEYLSSCRDSSGCSNQSISPQSRAYVVYTSGSSGAPKGVQVVNDGLCNHMVGFSRLSKISKNDVVLQFSSLAFDAAYEEIFPCLAAGARLVLRSETMAKDVGVFVDECERQGITILDLPTAFWHLLSSLLEQGAICCPSSVRLIVIGGEKADAKHLNIWKNEDLAQRIVILNTYGPTETTIIASSCDITDPALDGVSVLPIGQPVLGVEFELSEIDKEILISGKCLSRGYLNDPRLTAERFIPSNGVEAGSRCYRSGDLGSMNDRGAFLYQGRDDNQVKLNGFRIQLEEVEKALLSHPSIRQCVVKDQDNRVGGKHLVAYCIQGDGDCALPFETDPLSVSSLKDFLRERIPDYMVPNGFYFLEKFILNDSGKIDRSKLPEIGYLDRKYRRLPDFEKPRAGIETQLANIWCDVLDLEFEEVSSGDPFEYLGGNSLYSIQVRFRAREAGIHFRAKDMHLRQSIRELAKLSESRDGKSMSLKTSLSDFSQLNFNRLKSVGRSVGSAFRIARRTKKARVVRKLRAFYEKLENKENIVYLFFSPNLLHWLWTTMRFVPDNYNIVFIGSELREAEEQWVRDKFNRPFLCLSEEVKLDLIWDVLFEVNQKNFGWLDVECFIMNPKIFSEMISIRSDEAINCLWTHAACGPTKRPFHVLESYFLFFNIDVINRMKDDSLLTPPSSKWSTLRQSKRLKRLIPGENSTSEYFDTMEGNAFAHRMLNFDFAPLILYQLLANASGYKLNRVRFYTEIDSFNPYNYYSDEVMHVFPTIRYFDTVGWWGRNQKFRLASDYLLMTSMLDSLPSCYRKREKYLRSKFRHFDMEIESTRREIKEYLIDRGVTQKTFSREEFVWLDRPMGNETSGL